jgi:hypothetical protein
MFDSDLVEFSWRFASARSTRRRLELTIRATFRSFDAKTMHLLTFEGIKVLSACHKLTDEGVELMRHASFESGAKISITYERVRRQTKRNR